MATTVNLRKVLDLKRWEMCCGLPAASQSASQLVASTLSDGLMVHVDSITTAWLYRPDEDGWLQLSSPGFTTWSQPAGAYHPSGPTGTASAGSTTTLTSTTTVPGSLAGYKVRITAGTGAGQEATILSNTYGANSVLTFAALGVGLDNTSVYLILSGRYYFINTSTTVMMKYYDVATNTWSAALVVTGISASGVGSGSALCATPGAGGSALNSLATGTATSGSATTITNSGKAWATNQWANYQVRITAGTGAGKVAVITSNTGTVLTFPTVTTVLDNTSVYVIEGNDDALYLIGGNAVTLYKYTISGNTWSTVTPGAARTTVAGPGCTLSWIVSGDAAWTVENTIKDGNRLYSFAGGSVGLLAYYDIAANTWVNTQAVYGRSGGGDFAPSNAWYFCTDRGAIYLARSQVAGGHAMYRFDAVKNNLDPWSVFVLPAVTLPPNANRMAIGSYTDGGTTIRWVYYLTASNVAPVAFYRQLII